MLKTQTSDRNDISRKGKTMNLTEHFKQRLIQALEESRQSEERKLTARVGKASNPRQTREGDPSRVTLAGMGGGTDPLNRARQREMNAAFGNSEKYSKVFGMAKAKGLQTNAAFKAMGETPIQ